MKWISKPRIRRVQSTTRDICLIHACCSEGFICWGDGPGCPEMCSNYDTSMCQKGNML